MCDLIQHPLTLSFCGVSVGAHKEVLWEHIGNTQKSQYIPITTQYLYYNYILLWEHHGNCSSLQLWEHYGKIKGIRWKCYGFAMGTYNCGNIMGRSRE